MTRAFVLACGKWVEVYAEKVRKAARAGAVFEAVVAPVVKDCAWGEIERRDGVLTGFSKGLAEQYLVRHWGERRRRGLSSIQTKKPPKRL